jgi:hypothetical protein
MFLFRLYSSLAGLLMLASIGTSSHAGDNSAQPLGLCIAAAQHQLGKFHLDEKTLESRCECVQARLHGEFPTTDSGWKNSPNNNAPITLIECAKSDIISHFSGVILKSEISILENTGEPTQERDIQEVEDFSACAGEGFYNELLHSVKSHSDRKAVTGVAGALSVYDSLVRQCDATTQPGKRAMNICIVAAKTNLDVFGFDTSTWEKSCQCVKRKQMGKLPLNFAGWERGGKDSANLLLIECSKEPITRFIDGATFDTVRLPLQQKGYPFKNVKRYSSCVADTGFNELRHKFANGNFNYSKFDGTVFRKIGGSCKGELR